MFIAISGSLFDRVMYILPPAAPEFVFCKMRWGISVLQTTSDRVNMRDIVKKHQNYKLFDVIADSGQLLIKHIYRIRVHDPAVSNLYIYIYIKFSLWLYCFVLD